MLTTLQNSLSASVRFWLNNIPLIKSSEASWMWTHSSPKPTHTWTLTVHNPISLTLLPDSLYCGVSSGPHPSHLSPTCFPGPTKHFFLKKVFTHLPHSMSHLILTTLPWQIRPAWNLRLMQEIPVILYIQYNFKPANLIKSYPPSTKTDTRNVVSWATPTLSLHRVVDSRMLEQIFRHCKLLHH